MDAQEKLFGAVHRVLDLYPHIGEATSVARMRDALRDAEEAYQPNRLARMWKAKAKALRNQLKAFEPEIAVECHGITVYHSYGQVAQEYDDRNRYWYTLDDSGCEESELAFDVRELPCYNPALDTGLDYHRKLISNAIRFRRLPHLVRDES